MESHRWTWAAVEKYPAPSRPGGLVTLPIPVPRMAGVRRTGDANDRAIEGAVVR